MKLKLQAENPLEWMAQLMNLAPTPLIHTQIYFTVARAIMAGAELGIYEAIGKGSQSADAVSEKRQTHPGATKQLLDCLVGIGYLDHNQGQYSLKKQYHKWLLSDSESNMIGKLRFQLMEWDVMGKLEDFVRTGQALDLHHTMDDSKNWKLYQEGMRDLSINAAKELAEKVPFPFKTGRMLDIGGSHGLYSIELCKKYPGLSSTVLDLPAAIESASAIAKRYDTTGRVTYQAGNALNDDLGMEQYELVMINNVVHHFTHEQNMALAAKIARALKPGGIYAIGDMIRQDKPGEGGVIASSMGLYFSLTSSSGNWSVPEMQGWQSAAGLQSAGTVSAMSLPGWKMVLGKKG